jgi:menaquinone-dependent protoporphyrinogen oxidase
MTRSPSGGKLAAMKRVLVAYASKRGSTAEIAQAIAEELRRDGLDAECRQAGDVHALDPYDAIVVGSAVYAKRWQADARRFLRKHAGELARRPFWIFSSGPVGVPNKTPDRSWLEPPRTIARAQQLGVRDHVVFGGRVPAQPRGPIERAMARSTPPEYRDLRDWDEIRSWSARVAGELQTPVAA